MGRRRAEGPVVSLFSFQDLITSLMGITIFLVLLLALDSMTSAFTPPVLSRPAPMREAVQTEMKTLMEQSNALQPRIEALRLRSASLATNSRGCRSYTPPGESAFTLM